MYMLIELVTLEIRLYKQKKKLESDLVQIMLFVHVSFLSAHSSHTRFLNSLKSSVEEYCNKRVGSECDRPTYQP